MGLIRKQAGFDLRSKVQAWLDEFKKEHRWSGYSMHVGDNDTIWIKAFHNRILEDLFNYPDIPPYICFEFRLDDRPAPRIWVFDMSDKKFGFATEVIEFLNRIEIRYMYRVRVTVPARSGGTRIECLERDVSSGEWQINERYYGTN